MIVTVRAREDGQRGVGAVEFQNVTYLFEGRLPPPVPEIVKLAVSEYNGNQKTGDIQYEIFAKEL